MELAPSHPSEVGKGRSRHRKSVSASEELLTDHRRRDPPPESTIRPKLRSENRSLSSNLVRNIFHKAIDYCVTTNAIIRYSYLINNRDSYFPIVR